MPNHFTQRAGFYAGQQALLLANGPSLKQHPLQTCPHQLVGLNQSWRVTQPLSLNPLFHCCGDWAQYGFNPPYYHQIKERLLFMGDWPVGRRLPYAKSSTTFSDDPFGKGVRIGINGVGSITYVALQVCFWLGFDHVWICGLDMTGPKFTGQPAPFAPSQDKLFSFIPPTLLPRITVIEPSATQLLQKASWPWA